MTDKKRKPRIVTEATKAKLPKPRKRSPRVAPPVPCMDWPADSLPSGDVRITDAAMLEFAPIPDTAPYPWRVQVREWLEDRVEPLRWWLALKLERLAHWVAP